MSSDSSVKGSIYKSQVAQLDLLMQHGPLGVKVENGVITANTRNEYLRNHVSVFFTIFTRQHTAQLAAVTAQLKQNVSQLNEFYREMTQGKEYGLDDDVIKASFKTIELWNKQFGLPNSIKGSFQSALLRASGLKWKALHIHNYYIQFSIPHHPGTVRLSDRFICSFSNVQQLPLILSPRTQEDASSNALISWLKTNKDLMPRLFEEYGAIKFSGFAVDDPKTFEAVVEAATSSKTEDYVGGDGSRDRIDGPRNIYTSTKAEGWVHIDFHQERSWLSQMPQFISFYCDIPPRRGTGQTSLARAVDVTRTFQLTPIWDRYCNRDLTYSFRYPPAGSLISRIVDTHKTWQQSFDIPAGMPKAEARAQVERIAKERGYDIAWDGDWLVRRSTVPATRENPYVERSHIWMNQVHSTKLTEKLVGSKLLYLLAKLVYILPRTFRADVSFANGNPVTTKDVSQIFDVLRQHKTLSDWQKGEVLVLDNRLIMHGKEPHSPKEGQRRIYAAMSS